MSCNDRLQKCTKDFVPIYRGCGSSAVLNSVPTLFPQMISSHGRFMTIQESKPESAEAEIKNPKFRSGQNVETSITQTNSILMASRVQ